MKFKKMGKKNFNVLKITSEQLSPFIQLLLLFTFSIKKNTILIFLIIIPKYISLIIITSNCSINLFNDSLGNNYIIRDFFSKFTLFNYILKVKINTYYTISIFLFILELIFLSYLIKYFYLIKNNKQEKIFLEFYPKILFYLNIIFSPFIIEFLSFISIILFKSNLFIPSNPNYINSIFLNEINLKNKAIVIVIILIHIFEFIFIEFFIFASFISLNSFHKTQKNKLNIQNIWFFIFFNLISIINGCYYYEIIIKNSIKKIFKITISIYIFSLLSIKIIYGILIFERVNLIFFLIYYLDIFNYISLIFHIIVNLKKYIFNRYEIYIITLLIVLFSLLCTYCFLEIRNFFFFKKIYLIFIKYDSEYLKKLINYFHFYLDKLYDIKCIKMKQFSDIFNSLKKHKKICNTDDCKCRIFKIIPDWNINNIEYSKKLIKELSIILESTFVNIQIYSNFDYIYFLINYFNSIKENRLFTLSIINTYLSKNFGKLTIIQGFILYSIYFEIMKKYPRSIVNNETIIKYENIYYNIMERIKFRNNVYEYCKAFNKVIDIKINFENTLKIITDESNEIIFVNSFIFKKSVFVDIIQQLYNLYKISDRVQQNLIKYCLGNKGADFYYQIFLFFSIFCKNIPEEILISFNKLTNGDSFKNLTFEEMSKKFDTIINKYLKKGIENSHLILSFSKGIKIDYCSSNLCNRLNFSPAKIRNQDFFIFFPLSLREPHYKAILHFLINHNNFIFEMNRVIFDKNEHSIPCKVKSCVLPYLSKNLVIINEIFLKNDNNYSFILDHNFEAVSISHFFQKNYHFTLDMLRKSETPLRYIFNLHKHSIEKAFKTQLNIVKKIRKKLKNDILEFFTQSLYLINDNSSESSIIDTKKLNKYYENLNKKNSKITKYQNETFTSSIKKYLLLQNLIKSLNKLSDSPLKEDCINSIINEFLLLTKSGGNNNESPKRMSAFSAGFLPNINDSIEIHLTCKFKILYDIALYYFKFEEINNPHSNNSNIPTHILRRGSIVFKTTTTNFLFLNTNSRKSNVSLNMSQISKSSNKDEPSEEQEIEKKNNKMNIMIANTTNYNMKKTIKSFFKKKKKDEFDLLLKINIILIIICFIFSISSVIYKNHKVKKMNVFAMFYSQSCFLFDKIGYLYTLIIGEIYELGQISTKEYNLNILYTNLKINLDYLIYAKQKFYKYLNLYNKNIGNDRRNNVFTVFKKTSLTWEINEGFSDIFQELYGIVFMTSESIKDINISNFLNDFNNLWFKNYEKNPKKKIETSLVKLAYFYLNNFETGFKFIFNKLKEDSYYDLTQYLKKSKNIITIIEICWLIFNIGFFLMSFLIFYKFHKIILTRVISLFFINTKIDKNSIKSRPENFYMKEKIKLFIELIQDFSSETKLQFQNLQNNFIEKFCKNDFTTLYGTSTIYPLLNFPFEEINNEINEIKNIPIIHNSSKILSTNLNNSTLNATGDNLLNNSHLIFNNNKDNLKKEKHSNNKIKKIKEQNKKEQNNKNINSDNKKKNNLIPTEIVIHELTKKIVIFSHIMLITLISLFILSIIILYLQYHSTSYYNKRFNQMIYVFNTFLEYFHEIPEIFNSIRIYILLHEPFPDSPNIYLDNLDIISKNITIATKPNSFNYNTGLKYFWDQIHLPLNSTNINITYICNGISICSNFLISDKSYFTEGIRLGYQLLIQCFFAIIVDYNNLIRNNPNFTTNDIINLLKKNDFGSIQNNIDIIFCQIQNLFYTTFLDNYKKQKDYLSYLTNVFNYAFFLYQILIFLIVILWMGYYIKKKTRDTKKGGRLFKLSFFKDSGIQ